LVRLCFVLLLELPKAYWNDCTVVRAPSHKDERHRSLVLALPLRRLPRGRTSRDVGDRMSQ
jgi:hypothetical protein